MSPREHSKIMEALCSLAKESSQLRAIIEKEIKWARSRHGVATKNNIEETEKKIMSAISDFSAKQKAYNDRISNAIDGISTDIGALNDKITELQNSPGAITAEDQALLDEAQRQGEAVATKVEALDNLNPPTPPPS